MQIGFAVDGTTSNGAHTIEIRYYENLVSDQINYRQTHAAQVNIQGPGIYTVNITLPTPDYSNRLLYYGIRSSTLRFLTYPSVASPTAESSTANPNSDILHSEFATVPGLLLFFMKYQINGNHFVTRLSGIYACMESLTELVLCCYVFCFLFSLRILYKCHCNCGQWEYPSPPCSEKRTNSFFNHCTNIS